MTFLDRWIERTFFGDLIYSRPPRVDMAARLDPFISADRRVWRAATDSDSSP